MAEFVQYDPLPTFQPFHECSASQAALIGGYGSGKSRALVAEALKLGLMYPGAEYMIARKTVPSLRDTTESDFLDQLPPEFLKACKVARGGGHVQSLILPNNTKYYFKSLDDWRKIKSLNLAGIFVDEADEIDEETYDGLMSRLRQVTPRPNTPDAARIPMRVMRLACNPAGKNWIWRLFVKEPTRDRVGFISTSLDNPYNPKDYIDRLLAYPEPWVRRYVFCSFDDFEGSVYPSWDWNSHVVDPYGAGAYQRDSFFWMGMDPGTAHPTAGVWCYYDPHRHAMVAVAEYAAVAQDVSSHVAQWQQIERHGTHNLSRHAGAMNVARRIADPSIATRDRGTMMSLERQYASKGFYFEHGPREIPKRMPMLGELIHLQQFLVTKECEQLYWQLKNYRYEDLTPAQREKGIEPKPLKRDVDLVDSAQYIASRRVPDYDIKPQPIQHNDTDDPRVIELEQRLEAYKDAGQMDAALDLELALAELRGDWRMDVAKQASRQIHEGRQALPLTSGSRGLV